MMVFENYSRSEAALVTTMAEMVVSGVSTRKVARGVETLCGTSVSKSAVSEVCKDLDKEVEAFRDRPIEGNYPFLTIDATYFKVRENGRVISKALMIAYGTGAESEPRRLSRICLICNGMSRRRLRKRYGRYDAPGRDSSLLPDIKPYRATEPGAEAAFRSYRNLSK